jgi:hypothetical protein
MVTDMSYNDGAGPDEELAVKLADALDAVLDGLSNITSTVTATRPQFTDTGTAWFAQTIREQLGVEGDTPEFEAAIELVRDFARFARASGGFSVL